MRRSLPSIRPAVALMALLGATATLPALALTDVGDPAAAAVTSFAREVVLTDDEGRSTRGAEPTIEVDSHGSVYVTAPAGVPTGGCPFWEVTPDALGPSGKPYTYRGTVDTDRFGVGGGDCDVSLTDNPDPTATHDVVSITSLSLANLTSNTTSDGGATFVPVANPASQQVFAVDRQWQASDRGLDRHYLTVHDLATSNIQVAVSTVTGGYQYVSNVPAIDPTVSTQALSAGVLGLRGTFGGNSFGTTVVDPQTHKLYIPYVAPSGDTFDYNAVWVAEGDPCATVPCERGLPAGPISWTNHRVYTGPLTAGLGDGFPAIALDGAGVLHLAWTGDAGKPATAGSGQDANRVFTIRSGVRDVRPGSWSTPQAVDPGTAHANVFPWMVAGDGGRVGIAWYSSTRDATCPAGTVAGPTTDVNDDCRNVWTVQYAESHDANGPAPTWRTTQASSGPVHRGAICVQGLNCPAGTRTLLDYFDMALDGAGRPHLAFNSDVREPGTPDIHYTRQCTGTTLRGLALGSTCGTTGEPPAGLCPGTAGFVDPAGDATEVFVSGQTPLPSDPALDLLSGSITWDATRSALLLRARVSDLTAPPLVGDGYYRWQLAVDGDPEAYSVSATVPADGGEPTFDLFGAPTSATTAQVLTGEVDRAAGTVTIVLPSSAYEAANAGNTPLTATRALTVTSVLGQRVVAVVTPTADTAAQVCSGPPGSAVVVTPTGTTSASVTPSVTPSVTVTPSATVTASPSGTPSTTPSTTPSMAPSETVTPSPTCTKPGNGQGQGSAGNNGQGNGQGSCR